MAYGQPRSDKKFGLPNSVGDTMDILKVLAKNDDAAISRFWKTNAANAMGQKASLFHTLAMLDGPRLLHWIESTPSSWWGVVSKKSDHKTSKEETSIAARYQDLAGGMLHYLHKESKSTFMDLLGKAPYLFQATSCRYYVAEWCEGLTQEQLGIFQPILSKMPVAWYATDPQRVHFLVSIERNEQPMLAAALASKGVVHPLLEQKYPGLGICLEMASSMMDDAKQKKAYVRQWMVQQMGPSKQAMQFDLPSFDGIDY